MKLTSHTPHKKARIEIIPLIDIMFFLLASFMLVSMSMMKLKAVQTNLPSAKSQPQQNNKPDFVAIGIDRSGAVYFDKDKAPTDPDSLPQRLQPFYALHQADTKVFINCDQDASYDFLVSVLDEVRALGITKVSFAMKLGNHFDPDKPRPTTHPPLAGEAGAAPAAGAAGAGAPGPASAPAATVVPTAPSSP